MDRTTLPAIAVRRRHAALMTGCALGVVLAAMPEAAVAAPNPDKGFQAGTPTINAGDATVATGGTGSKLTQINVKAAQTVITWTPDDPATSGTIDFLPNGYTAQFGSSSLTDYTVLNRILPGGTATIGLNGTIKSSVSDGGRGQTPGGNVWFYTPNGFVVGPTAVIQVGGLVMTTNDIVYGAANTGGDTLTDSKGNVLFRGTTPGSSIVVQPGAQIVGANANAYVALVSPRVEQGGYVSADRSIAYVAGKQVDLRINAGNFDIAIGEGTDDANGIVHTGTTTGAASSGYLDTKAMQFVAVSKNTALTMLLSGSIGYTPASAFYSDGSSIVLTAGADGSPDGNIAIVEGDFRNRVNGHATGDLTVAPASAGPFTEGVATTTFENSASLSGDKSVKVLAEGGTAVRALNGLSLYSDNATSGGSITVQALAGGGFAPAGEVAVSGFLSADASHTGGTSDNGAVGFDSTGGSVTIAADGGTITTDYLEAYATGYGGFGSVSGGNGQGGTIAFRAGLGGALNAANAYGYAQGHGGGSYECCEPAVGGRGGIGRGGTVTVADSSGPLDEDPSGGSLGISGLYLDASAIGGNSLNYASGLGGDAFGGSVTVTLDRQDQAMGYLSAYAQATDGDSGSLDPLGGTVTMNVGGGISASFSDLYLNADATASINSPAGALGKGGTVALSVSGGADVTVQGTAQLSAGAFVSSPYNVAAISSPDLTGGTATLTADGGSFQAQNIYVYAEAYNVGAETAGFAQGGTARVRAANGGTIATVADPFSEGSGGYFQVSALAQGTGGAQGTVATGGTVGLAAESSATITGGLGTINLNAKGQNGYSYDPVANGVVAHGGTITVDALGGTVASGIVATADGLGGDADNAGGMGTGGNIDVRVLGGTLVNPLYASAGGLGGYAYAKGDGGDGRGGRFTLTSNAGATFQDFALSFYGDAQGGGAVNGVGGDGFAGGAQIDILGGSHTWSDAYLSAVGRGAASNGTGSVAGSGAGAGLGLAFHLGGGASLTVPYLSMDARGYAGGDNPGGNSAVGGTASLLVDQRASLSADAISLNASGSMAFEERNPDSYSYTPTANGGTVSVVADGGTITTSFLEAVANGMSGGALTRAGNAVGGRTTVGSASGGLINIVNGGEGGAELIIEARGLGAEGPSAATASGGVATLYTEGGSIRSVAPIVVNANGEAGDFAGYFGAAGPATGYTANGGIALVEMRAAASGGGAVTAPSLTVTAQGLADQIGPVQGAGGIGRGGMAWLNVAQGALATGPLVLNARGRGGQADENPDGAAYASGVGLGGSAQFQLSGGSVDASYVNLTADGRGAAGRNVTAGAAASQAALGRGGTAEFSATGGTLTTSSSVTLTAQGIGGGGAYNPIEGAAGRNGADGFAGSSRFSAGGTTALNIGGAISIEADAFGGSAGSSFNGLYGAGGNATAGTASLSLADIGFSLGPVYVNAVAGGGYGSTLGRGTGGRAAFSLVDAFGTVAAPRTIDSLSLDATGYLASEQVDVGGTVAFTARIGSAGAGLTISNDLDLVADGSTGPAGDGIVGDIAGAPVTVGGSVRMLSPRSGQFTIANGAALAIAGDLQIALGGSFTSSGRVSAGGNASVVTGTGISMTDLSVGGSTLLRSLGPVTVSHDLSSAGPVTVSGSSVLLRSLGGLTFSDADATSGNLEIDTTGDLLVAAVDAAGSVTLTSSAGSVHNTGPVHGVGITYRAAGNVISDTAVASGGPLTVAAGGTFTAPGTVSAVGAVDLSADLGLDLSAVVSGGATALAARNGALSIGSLTSPGAVTAIGRAVTIAAPGALSFTSAQATAGDVRLTTGGNLSVTQGGATGAAVLTSTGGSVSGSGRIVTGGALTVAANSGVAFDTLQSGAATSLTTNSGAVAVQSLNSAGAVTARGGSVAIGSPGALTFADLDAAAGDVFVQTAGDLTLGTVDATASATLTSTGGALKANGAINANGIALSSFADLALNGLSTAGSISLTSTSGAVSSSGPIAAGGALAVSGNRGIALGTASSGANASLASVNGTVSVGDLQASGAVTASGGALNIASSGALRFANAVATAGSLTLAAAGNLIVSQASASGALTLASSGGSVTSTGTIVSRGNAGVSGQTGVLLGTLTSGGTTALTSAGGAVQVANLGSAGAVNASGQSLVIGSSGALSFADAEASAGNLRIITAGDLALARAGASGSLTLASSGGAITASSPLSAGGNTAIAGNAGITLGALTSGGTTALTSANGAVAVSNLNSAGAVTASGRQVTIGSTGALSFADLDATAGNVAVQTAGNLTVNTVDAAGSATLVSTGGALAATGAINGNGVTFSALANLALNGLSTPGAISLTSTSGGVSSTGPLAAGGNLSVAGNAGIGLGTASSGGTTSLTSANGNVVVTDLSSAGPLTASGRSVGIVSPGALTVANAQATTGNLSLTAAGDLSVAQAGAANTLRLTSTGGVVSGTGAIGSGSNATVTGGGGIALAALTSGGATTLTSANGAIAVTNLTSAGAVTASGRAVAIGSSGALSFADLDAAAGNVAVTTSGDLTVNTVDASGAVALTSTGGALQANGAINGNGIALSSFAALQLQGALATPGAITLTSTGGAVGAAAPVSAGGNLTVSGKGGISLGTAQSGGTTVLASPNGAVVVSNLTSSGAVTAAAQAVTIGSAGALNFADLDATAGGIAVQTAGNLAVASVDATGAVSLASSGGSLAATGAVNAGGSVAASGQTGVSLGTLTSGGPTQLSASNGAVTVTALTSAGGISASGRSVDLRGPASLTVANAQATAGNLALQAAQNLAVANGAATGSAALTAGANLAISGTLNAAGIALSGTNVSVGGQVRSTAALDVLARQVFSVDGLAAGQTVGVTSGDVAIGQTGRLGSRGLTKSITLRNRTVTAPMNIGGSGQQGQFSLDKSEAARLFADQQITFVSQAGEGTGGDVRIGELSLAFGDTANLGAGGLLKVDAGGVVTVNGAVGLTTVSNTDAFSIDPQVINVVAGSGSIVMKNASGALQGVIELQAGKIAVADQTTLDTIAGLSDFAAISAALDKPGAPGPQGGYLQAGTLNLIAGNAVLIQNAGASTAYADRRGFRANELKIETSSTAPQIAINGVIVGATGDLVGLDTAQGVSINGVAATEIDKGALVTINGCAAGVNCGIPDYSFGGLSSDELQELLATAEDRAKGPTGQPVQMEETQPLITPPLVDEPITGVGNDDLWQVKCTPEGDKSCPAEEGTE